MSHISMMGKAKAPRNICKAKRSMHCDLLNFRRPDYLVFIWTYMFACIVFQFLCWVFSKLCWLYLFFVWWCNATRSSTKKNKCVVQVFCLVSIYNVSLVEFCVFFACSLCIFPWVLISISVYIRGGKFGKWPASPQSSSIRVVSVAALGSGKWKMPWMNLAAICKWTSEVWPNRGQFFPNFGILLKAILIYLWMTSCTSRAAFERQWHHAQSMNELVASL